MKLKRFVVVLLALLLGTSGLTAAKAHAASQGPRYGQDNNRGGWEVPPQEFREIQRQGFRDGIDGFRKDMDNHRRPDVNNRDEYRNPRVPYNAQKEYREAFRRGYEVAMSHLFNPAPPPPANRGIDHDRGGWDAPPREFREIQRRGFQDGIEGFRRDMDNHRRPDVNNRDEFRNPNVPYGSQREYREGFRRGYEVAMTNLYNVAPQGQPSRGNDHDRGAWDSIPSEFREAQRQGFRDGMEGFRRDMDNNRRPDVNNRDEYRHPRVPFRDQADYLDGFRRGYDAALRHSMGR